MSLISIFGIFINISTFKIFLKRPTNALTYMNVTLLHSDHRHVSATHHPEDGHMSGQNMSVITVQ